MKKPRLALVLAVTAAAAGFGALATQDLQQHDQAVLARWAELHAAEQAQFAEVPAVLASAASPLALDARDRCGQLAQFDGGAPLIDDARRFDRYKQVRAECTGLLFRLLATMRADPLRADDRHVQALGLSLTQGQARVDAARERYREALAAYNQDINCLSHGVTAGLLGCPERPDFVRHADALSSEVDRWDGLVSASGRRRAGMQPGIRGTKPTPYGVVTRQPVIHSNTGDSP